jgi:hypothetical protein
VVVVGMTAAGMADDVMTTAVGTAAHAMEIDMEETVNLEAAEAATAIVETDPTVSETTTVARTEADALIAMLLGLAMAHAMVHATAHATAHLAKIDMVAPVEVMTGIHIMAVVDRGRIAALHLHMLAAAMLLHHANLMPAAEAEASTTAVTTGTHVIESPPLTSSDSKRA